MLKSFFTFLLLGNLALISSLEASSVPSEKRIPTKYSHTAKAVVQVFAPLKGNRKPLGFAKKKAPISQNQALLQWENILRLSVKGSGFIYEFNGQKYVITNAHVIDAGKEDSIFINQGMEGIPLKLIGGDTFYDIAVLGFKSKKDSDFFQHTLSFSTNPLNQGGEFSVLARPFPQTRSRNLPPGHDKYSPYYYSKGGIVGLYPANGNLRGKRFFDTDADIFKGCSGSPLLDDNDEVIGINTSRIKTGNTHLNRCISGVWAKEIIERIITSEAHRVSRGFLGLVLQQKGKVFQLPASGIILEDVMPNSPAATALEDEANDKLVLKAINNERVPTLDHALAMLDEISRSNKVDLTFYNPTKNITKTVAVYPKVFVDRHLEGIATHFFTQFGPLNPVQRNQILDLKGDFEGPTVKVSSLDPTGYCCPNKDRSMTLDGSGGDGGFNEKFFRIETLKDLGVMVRMGAYSGKVELFGHTDRVFKQLTISPGRFGSVPLRMLYY